jgi:hypothetical protein
MDRLTPPPAPNPSPGQQQPMQRNALMMPSPQQNTPAPSHQETVAALRHFMSIVNELKTLQANPSLGKSNVKTAIIDGVTGLVSQRLMSPANAVSELSKVPDDPRAQRQWVEQTLQQTIKAQNNVLDHHVAGSPATLDWGHESQQQPGSPDDHMQTMDGLAGQYRPS